MILYVVTPYVGVWIETFRVSALFLDTTSHPTWVCGLKPKRLEINFLKFIVTPYVGVWIETKKLVF